MGVDYGKYHARRGDYDRGYIDGSRFVANAFASNNVYLGPLVVTSSLAWVSDSVFINTNRAGDAIVMNLDSNTPCLFFIEHCHIWLGPDSTTFGEDIRVKEIPETNSPR